VAIGRPPSREHDAQSVIYLTLFPREPG